MELAQAALPCAFSALFPLFFRLGQMSHQTQYPVSSPNWKCGCETTKYTSVLESSDSRKFFQTTYASFSKILAHRSRPMNDRELA